MTNFWLGFESIAFLITGSVLLLLSVYLNWQRKLLFFLGIIFFVGLFIVVSFYLGNNTFSEPKFYLILQLVIAVGTCGVIVIAVFGKKIQMFLLPIKFKIELVKFDGEINIRIDKESNQIREVYFHLRVVNRNPPSIIKNCRVVLKKIRILTAQNGEEIKYKNLIAPYSFKWALTHQDDRKYQKYHTFSHEASFDFVRVNIGKQKIMPVLVDYFNDFENFFNSQDKYIYEFQLQIKGDNYLSNESQYFQVRWDGSWADAPEQIVKDLKIKEVFPA